MALCIKGTEPLTGGAGGGWGDCGQGEWDVDVPFVFTRKGRITRRNPRQSIECGGMGSRSYRGHGASFTQQMCGVEKISGRTTHRKRTLAKLGKSVRNYGCAPTSAARRMCSRSPPKSHKVWGNGYQLPKVHSM